MKNKARRIVSVICALAMCAAMVPAVFADSETVNATSNAASSSVTDTSSSDTTKDSAADTTTGTASGSTSGPATAPGTDTGTDTSADTSTDATTDTSTDTSTDSLKDTVLDTNADTTADTTTDGTVTEGSTAPGSSPLPGETTPSDTPDDTSNADAGTDTPDSPLNGTGVTILKSGAADTVFNIGEDQVLMISGQDQADNEPIIFKNCTFNLSGGTVKISGNQDGILYNNGETVTKLFISGSVQFDNCRFVTAEGAAKTTSAGYDAAIYFFSGDIVLNGCELSAEGYNGQFLGLYGSSGSVTFNDSNISTVGNKNGWSYAMYAGSVLKLNRSTMTAAGSSTDSGNINVFYSGDNRTGYDAIYFTDSTIDFSDNKAGSFAINNVNIHVNNSDIIVDNNLGNACNSGYWIVTNGSSITMNGNRGGHALSCIGFEMSDSKLEILHNGYAGVYIQSKDSSLTNCTVDIRCNGEKMLSYSAGDVWLNGHTLTVSGGTSNAQEGSPWLGAVGRKGSLITTGTTSVVAYDLNNNAVDNLKSNTAACFGQAQLTLNSEADQHTLLLNPFMESDYARGNAENSASSNDADLFKTDVMGNGVDPLPVFATDEEKTAYILGGITAKIGTLTTAQLAHHKYDWTAGTVKYEATVNTYGAMAYPCVDVCGSYITHTGEHPNSFNCAGTYVYAPLVGLHFESNLPAAADPETDAAIGMPDDQTQISYNAAATAPAAAPTLSLANGDEYAFTGWYTDPECTQPFDFNTALTDNWTIVYAGWEKVPETPPTVTVPSTPTPDEHPDIAEGIANGTWGGTPTPTPTAQTTAIPQTSDDLPLGLLIVVAIAAAGAVCGLVVLRKRSKQ